MNLSVIVVILAALALPAVGITNGSDVIYVDEKTDLQRALDNACRQFSSEDQSLEADRCRREFFSAHEEAIWRLNLNPHRTRAGPSS